MRLRYLERNPAAREALQRLAAAFRFEEQAGRILLVSRQGSGVRQVETVEELLDAAAQFGAGQAATSWRVRARQIPAARPSDPDLLRALETWKRRAVVAEAALRDQRAGPGNTGAIRRLIARALHPDAAPTSEAERALRTELFQRVWSALERGEAQG